MDRSVCAWTRPERDIPVCCIALRQLTRRPWAATSSASTRPHIADSRNRDWLGNISGSGRGAQRGRQLAATRFVSVAFGRSAFPAGSSDLRRTERGQAGGWRLVRLHTRLFWSFPRVPVWLGSLFCRQHGFCGHVSGRVRQLSRTVLFVGLLEC